MTDKKLKERNQIPDSYKWNIRAMYPDESKWDSDIEECMTRAEKFGCYRGRLTESASTLLEALRDRDSIWENSSFLSLLMVPWLIFTMIRL